MPKSQHTTQQLPLLVAACRTASLRRSTSTTSTVVSSLSRPNLAGVSAQTSARPGWAVRSPVGAVGLGGGAPRQTCHAGALPRLPRDPAHPGVYINTHVRAQPRPRGHVTEGSRGLSGHLCRNVCMYRPGGGTYPVSSAARRDVISFRPRAAAPLVADALRRAQQRVRGALRRRRLAHQLARLRVADHVPQPVAGEQQPRVGACGMGARLKQRDAREQRQGNSADPVSQTPTQLTGRPTCHVGFLH